jgi:ribosome-associated protein
MKIIIPWNEITWTATRSSGAGGQHVNKTNSAVQLRFSISNSLVLTEDQKQRLIRKLSHRLIQDDEILIRIEDERDQKRNKDKAYELLNILIQNGLKEPKKRIATKPKKSSVRKRLEGKKIRSDIKKNRSEKIKW